MMHPDTDSVTFILGRYFSPHPSAIKRDSHARPVCPGPLALNHCLWTYAVSANSRQMLVQYNGTPTRYFEQQRFIFGVTEHQQNLRFQDEKNAYFCIHPASDIEKRVCMSREYLENTLDHSDTWLETVAIS